MVDFQFFQSCLSTSYWHEKKKGPISILSLMYKKLSLLAECALSGVFFRKTINLISCFSLVLVLLRWCCVFHGIPVWCCRRWGLHGCSVPLQFCMRCHPFLRASAFPAPSEPLEGAVACQHGLGWDGMGCVSRLTVWVLTSIVLSQQARQLLQVKQTFGASELGKADTSWNHSIITPACFGSIVVWSGYNLSVISLQRKCVEFRRVIAVRSP